MLNVLQLKKVMLNMQLCVVKVEKCKQSGINTSIQNLHYNYTNCQKCKR
jgi:hypothetical protein